MKRQEKTNTSFVFVSDKRSLEKKKGKTKRTDHLQLRYAYHHSRRRQKKERKGRHARRKEERDAMNERMNEGKVSLAFLRSEEWRPSSERVKPRLLRPDKRNDEKRKKQRKEKGTNVEREEKEEEEADVGKFIQRVS